MSNFRKIAVVFFILITIICLSNYQLTIYLGKQFVGQVSIFIKSKSVYRILDQHTLPDSLSEKLRLICEIKHYAVDRLHLEGSQNYELFYDQHSKPLLWLVTGCEKFEMRAFEWRFPVMGNVSYKGYFDQREAHDESDRLKQLGYDAYVREVNAWSTLGYLPDPIFSNFLYRSEGDLAELIIHELTHTTVYLKNQSTFNENLATFVGEEGAKKFLKEKYGLESRQYVSYLQSLNDNRLFVETIIQGSQLLDSLYSSFADSMPNVEKEILKSDLIAKIIDGFDTIQFSDTRYLNYIRSFDEINNAFFINYLTYNKNTKQMHNVYVEKFESDLPRFIEAIKRKFGTNP